MNLFRNKQLNYNGLFKRLSGKPAFVYLIEMIFKPFVKTTVGQMTRLPIFLCRRRITENNSDFLLSDLHYYYMRLFMFLSM